MQEKVYCKYCKHVSKMGNSLWPYCWAIIACNGGDGYINPVITYLSKRKKLNHSGDCKYYIPVSKFTKFIRRNL